MNDEIRTDEWLAELRAVEAQYPDGFTAAELAKQFGVGTEAARTRLKKLIDAGRAVFAGKRSGMRMDGSACMVPVYRLVKRKR